MHLVIAFAAPLSDPGRAVLKGLQLPGLRALLAGRQPQLEDGEALDEWSLSPPHERALARAHGWPLDDGSLPVAAGQACADGLPATTGAWALLTPSHWHLGTEQLSLADPATLGLTDDESRSLAEAVGPLFTSEGFTFHAPGASRWYLSHPSLATLPTASIDRVIGRNVDRWLPGGPQARLLRRLQNEVQMLLHTHPVNADRESRGLLPVNSVWISGTGAAQPAAAGVRLETSLRGPALAEDWAAWAQAWIRLDADLAAHPPVTLTLCGERRAARLDLAPQGALARWLGRWSAPAPHTLLERL